MSKYMGFSANDKKNIKSSGADDWDTDPNYVNDVSEKDQRWGSKELGGKPKEVVNMNELRAKVKDSDDKEKKEDTKKPNYAYGYGGKFGVQNDRMDKSAHTNAVEEDKSTNKSSYKPQGPLKDTKSAAKVFEDKAAANKVEPVKPSAPKPMAGGFKNKFENPAPTPAPVKLAPKAAPVKAPPVKAPEPVRVPEPEPEPEPIVEPVKATDDWEAPKVTDDWEAPKATDDWEAPKANNDWEAPVEPEKPATNDWESAPSEPVQEEVTQDNSYEQSAPVAGGNLPTQARALYDFEAQDTEELAFKTDDIITIIQAVDNEWWQGEIDGRTGIFPVSYVEAL